MASFSRPFPRILIAAAVAVVAVTAVMFMAIQATQKPRAAWADTVANINPAHIGATAAGFETQECDGPLATPPGPNYDGWHFVLPASSGDNFTSITIVYSGLTAGPITSTDANNPDSGAGWVGFLRATGSGDVRHAYIFTTPQGMSIVSGTATVTPNDPTPPGRFNLSHTCPASASPSPSPSPSRSVSPSPSRSVSPSPSVSPSRSVSPSPSASVSTSPTPSASTSRPPRPSPSRTRPPGYGYGNTEHTTVRVSWWRSYFG